MEECIDIVNDKNEIANLPDEPRPWGIWVTIGFTIFISIVFLVLQVIPPIVIVTIKKLEDPSFDIHKYCSSFSSNGLIIALATLLSGTVTSGLILLLGVLKKGITLRQYFKLNSIRSKDYLLWFTAMVLFIIVNDSISYLVQGQIVPDVMNKQYETAGFLPLFLFSMIIIAPLSEELFFRGFLFEGIRYSKLGNIGAVLITSLFWAVIHMQYDLLGITTIFFLGIMMGIARLKTNSLYTTILMHSFMNIVASCECIIINEFLR